MTPKHKLVHLTSLIMLIPGLGHRNRSNGTACQVRLFVTAHPGAQILQNQLLHRLPVDFTKTLPEGIQVAYAVIPQIKHLAEPLQMQVRVAFAESTRAIWYALIGFGGAGFLVSL